jgi:hypothetical protein
VRASGWRVTHATGRVAHDLAPGGQATVWVAYVTARVVQRQCVNVTTART